MCVASFATSRQYQNHIPVQLYGSSCVNTAHFHSPELYTGCRERNKKREYNICVVSLFGRSWFSSSVVEFGGNRWDLEYRLHTLRAWLVRSGIDPFICSSMITAHVFIFNARSSGFIDNLVIKCCWNTTYALILKLYNFCSFCSSWSKLCTLAQKRYMWKLQKQTL